MCIRDRRFPAYNALQARSLGERYIEVLLYLVYLLGKIYPPAHRIDLDSHHLALNRLAALNVAADLLRDLFLSKQLMTVNQNL